MNTDRSSLRPDGAAKLKRAGIYIAIGAIGFFVEAVTLSSLIAVAVATPVTGRIASFPLAVLVTWWLNRRMTFQSTQPHLPELARYAASQSLGALANLGSYTLLVTCVPVFLAWPVAALAVGAVAGLVVNYGLASFWVFRNQHRHA